MTMRIVTPGQLGRRIARTSNAEVFELGDHEVLKLFHDSIAYKDIEKEQRSCRLVQNTPLRVPATGSELVRCAASGRVGIAFEKIAGTTLLERIFRSPASAGRSLRLLVEEQRRMHAIAAPVGLMDQQTPVGEVLRKEHGLLPGEVAQVLRIQASLPRGSALCHGDFGAQNVMVDQGRVTGVIDWIDACAGNPLCDVARSWVILHFNQRTGPLSRWVGRVLAGKFLAIYRECEPNGIEQLEDWIIVNLAIRLRDLQGKAKHAVLVDLRRRLQARAPKLQQTA